MKGEQGEQGGGQGGTREDRGGTGVDRGAQRERRRERGGGDSIAQL